MVDFTTTRADFGKIERLADRAIRGGVYQAHRKSDALMDLSAAHGNNGNAKLDLDALIECEVESFHDLAGILRHINRQTGVLENCFSPRFTLKS